MGATPCLRPLRLYIGGRLRGRDRRSSRGSQSRPSDGASPGCSFEYVRRPCEACGWSVSEIGGSWPDSGGSRVPPGIYRRLPRAPGGVGIGKMQPRGGSNAVRIMAVAAAVTVKDGIQYASERLRLDRRTDSHVRHDEKHPPTTPHTPPVMAPVQCPVVELQQPRVRLMQPCGVLQPNASRERQGEDGRVGAGPLLLAARGRSTETPLAYARGSAGTMAYGAGRVGEEGPAKAVTPSPLVEPEVQVSRVRLS